VERACHGRPRGASPATGLGRCGLGVAIMVSAAAEGGPSTVTEADEPTDDDAPPDPFDLEGEDEGESLVPSWLGAMGQMIAALLVVVALVAAFIGAAAVLRRLLP
jgi:hypothetical protein